MVPYMDVYFISMKTTISWLLLLIILTCQSSCSGNVCDRITSRHSRWEASWEKSDSSLPAEHLRTIIQTSPGDEIALSEEILKLDRHKMKSNIEHYFSKSIDAELESTENKTVRPLVCMILSGQVRTMLETDILNSYKSIVSLVEGMGYDVHIFAYLELTPGRLYRRHFRDPKVSGPFIPQYEITQFTVEQGLEYLGASSHTLVIHDEKMIPDISLECTVVDPIVSSQAKQFLKVEAGFNMMKKYELKNNVKFDVVFRIRPDMCAYSIVKFVEFSLNHVVNTLLVFIVKDTAAILPRWAADAYSSAWRTFIRGCPIDQMWEVAKEDTCNDSRDEEVNVGVKSPHCLGGSIDTHLIGLGVEVLDLHRFWVHRPDPKNSSNVAPHEPTLRRPHGCVSFN